VRNDLARGQDAVLPREDHPAEDNGRAGRCKRGVSDGAAMGCCPRNGPPNGRCDGRYRSGLPSREGGGSISLMVTRRAHFREGDILCRNFLRPWRSRRR
jgi:hypothetical protein